MQLARLLTAAGLITLTTAAVRTSAQNEAPFTIRYPPDGASVRENVRVEVPLASIPEGGYVAYAIDGSFRVALSPTAEQRAAAAAKPGARFVFVWNTKEPMKLRAGMKEEQPKDGEHEISATLYVPSAGGPGASVAKQTSSVKVNLRNRISEDPGPIRLRYRFADGSSRYYNRKGDTSVVAGLSQGFVQGTTDQELVSQKSRLLIAVEDKYADQSAIIRNKLTDLTVRQGGQETEYPVESLPKSLYQQVSPLGYVLYQNDTPTFDQFAQLGVPVDTTLLLPKLPESPVRVKDTWVSPKERLDLPGTPPNQQPIVAMKSTFEGLEWEGGYPTAKIHQVFDSSKGTFKTPKTIVFGNVQVENPQIKYERDIYIAYRSGTLVKMVRRMEVTGKAAGGVQGGAAPGMGGAMPGGGMPGGSMYRPGGGMDEGLAGGGPSMSAMRGQMSSMRGRMGMGSGGSGMPPGVGGSGMGPMGPGMPGMPPGAGGRGMSSMMGPGSGAMRGRMMGPGGGGMGPSMPGAPGGAGMMMGPGMGGGMGGAGATGSTQITLKSTTTTELDRSGARVASF